MVNAISGMAGKVQAAPVPPVIKRATEAKAAVAEAPKPATKATPSAVKVTDAGAVSNYAKDLKAHQSKK